MARPTIINKFGTLIGWNNITINILGREMEGIEEVKYDDDIPVDSAYGAGKFPIGSTEGNYKATASVKLYAEEIIALQQQLPKGGRIQDIPAFDAIVQFEYGGQVYKDILRNCRFTKVGRESKNGEGKIVTDFPLHISHVDWNV
jgi:hypothetical protein